jgi:hypothetical protein
MDESGRNFYGPWPCHSTHPILQQLQRLHLNSYLESGHYADSFAAMRLQLHNKTSILACQHVMSQAEIYKFDFDNSLAPHKFEIETKVLVAYTLKFGKMLN